MMLLPTQDKEAQEQLAQFIKAFSEDGCPPSGDCENYQVNEETKFAVDCEMCLKMEAAKLIEQLGYHKGLPTSIEEALNSGDGGYRP